MNKKEFVTTLKIQTEADQAEKTIGKIGTQLSELWKHTQASKGTLRDLETLREKMASIKVTMDDVKASGGKTDALGLSTIDKDTKEIIKVTRELQRELKLLTEEQKRQMLSDTEKKAWEERAAAIKTYQQELEKAQKLSKERASLVAQRDSKTKSREELMTPILSEKGSKARDYIEKQERLAKITANIGRDRASGRFSEKEGNDNQLTRAIEQAKQLQEELAAAKLELGGDAGLAEAIADLEGYRQSLSQTEETSKDLSKEIEELTNKISKIAEDEEAEALERFKNALKAMGVEGVDAAENSEELIAILKELDNKALGPVNKAIDALSKEYGVLGREAQKMKQKVEDSNKALEEQKKAAQEREAFEGKIKQFLGMQGAAQLMRMALRDAMTTITELDATMAQMAVVTDLSIGDYWDQLPEYSKRASELGVSINSAYEAATLYYQQGLKTNEVVAISNETLKMAKIAGLSAADATDKMTAALRGFNMELNEASAQKISDVYSELAAITAADVNEISDAMTKTASIASSAGMEFETTAAFLSQIIETTRESAETAGTALKTVIARFQELKKDPSEIGEVDGEIVDANAIETALRSVGVSLRDAGGQFRELDDVFLELSKKWNTLDKNTQRYIATIAAGSRQQSRFIAMMQDYERTQELVTAANNSAGASQRQFEKTIDSLEAKVEKLKNAWHEFTMGIMNSDFVKFGVDILTKFLEVINKATSGIDGLGGSLVKIVGVLGVFKLGQKIFQKFRQPLIQFFADIVKESGIAGEKSAKEFKEAAQREKDRSEGGRLKEGYTRDKTGRIHRADGSFAKKDEGLTDEEKESIWEKIKSSSGISDFLEGRKTIKENGAKLRENKEAIKEKGSKLEELTSHMESLQNLGGDEDEIKGTGEEIKKLSKEIEGLESESEELFEKQAGGWEQAGAGIQKVGETITGVGLGVSALGGIFSALGLETLGESFAQVGNWITVAGTAVTAFGGALKMIPPLLTVISAHPIIAIIVAVLTLVLVTIVAITKALEKVSPEAKLKKAEGAAQKAGEAAEEAKEAYQGLANVLDELPDKHSAFEELTKGTKEWREALLETNQQVMDLIKNYPELAQYVKNVDGVLTLDTESDEVQAILNKDFKNSVLANNIALAADQQVLEAQQDVNRKTLTDAADFKYNTKVKVERQREGQTYTVEETRTNKLTQDQIDAYAKAYAEGKLTGVTDKELAEFANSINLSKEEFQSLQENIKNSSDDILKYGGQIQEKETQEMLLYDSMVNTVVSLVDTLEMSDQRIKQMFNLVDGEIYGEAYKEAYEQLSDDVIDGSSGEDTLKNALFDKGLTESQINEAFVAAGYKNAKFNTKSKEIEYTDENGDDAKEELDNDTIRRVLATYQAANISQSQAQLTDIYISSMSDKIKESGGAAMANAFEKALMSEGGEELTVADLDALQGLTKSDLIDYFNDLPQTMKDVFGSVENVYKDIESAKKGASFVKEAGFSGVTYGAAKGLDKIRGALGESSQGEFTNQFNTFIEQLTEDQKAYFAQQISSLSSDPKNREAWELALERLAKEGIDASGFASTYMSELEARYSDKYLTSLGVSDAMIANYNNATSEEALNKFHETFKKWKKDYDIVNSEAAKADHELMTQTIEALIENREKQIEAYREANDSINEANSNLIAKISDNVARMRELREKEETEKAITDNMSKQAYLAMDTSGSNSLEIMGLQQENEQMIQNYEDSLIDQAIAKLEDDNQKAADQRERQIALMESQLESYSTSEEILAEAKDLIDDASEALLNGDNIENTALGQLLSKEYFTSEFERAEFWTGLVSSLNARQGMSDQGDGTEEDKPNSGTKARNDIITEAATKAGTSKTLSEADYETYKTDYMNAGGEALQFDQAMRNLGIGVTSQEGSYTGEKVEGFNRAKSIFNVDDLEDGKDDQGVVKYGSGFYRLKASGSSTKSFATGGDGNLEVIKQPGTNKAKLYVNFNGTGYEILDKFDRPSLLAAMGLQAYKTGGLASFTGPAWLDGTPSKPEYVLNASQTERFFSLVDVLEGLKIDGEPKKSSGDNYFDINISIEKIEDDYDVEQMADKIRRMIYDDATYRNVNAINHIR